MKPIRNKFKIFRIGWLLCILLVSLIAVAGIGCGGGGGGGGDDDPAGDTGPTTDPIVDPDPGTDPDPGGDDGFQRTSLEFSVSDAKNLVATENIVSAAQVYTASYRDDGKKLPMLVFRKPSPEDDTATDGMKSVGRSTMETTSVMRPMDEETEGGSNLLAIDEEGLAEPAIVSFEELAVMYTVLSKDKKRIYIALDPDESYNAVQTIGENNCMIFSVSLQDDSYTCLDPGYAPQKMDNDYRKSISSSGVKPIQMDEEGNVYYLGSEFTVNEDSFCNQFDPQDPGVCLSENTNYWIDFNWNVTPVIRKIDVQKDQDGHLLYNEDGSLAYDDPVSLTPDNNFIENFVVSKDGVLVYTYSDWETGSGGIKMYYDGSTNALTDETTGGWWGDMFYMIGDAGTVIYGSAGDSWGNAGIKFAQRHPLVPGARIVQQLNTSLFTSRENSPTPSRIIMGDDGYIYGLFNEDAGYHDASTNMWVPRSRINLFRILPYKQTPIFSFLVEVDWWQAMNGFDVQICKGFAYYVQSESHPQNLYSDRDLIKITKLTTGETTTLLNTSSLTQGITIWDDRYEIYSWKLVGDTIHFSAFDNGQSQVVMGELDVDKLRQGLPALPEIEGDDHYLDISAAASALGESARIMDMEVITPAEVYDPQGAPSIVKIFTNPENIYSSSIDFSKRMNRSDVNSKVSVIDAASEEEIDLVMKVWSYKTLHLIFDTDMLNDTTDPLDPNTLYQISVDGDAFDYANEWQLDMADSPLLATTFKTVPNKGWYQSTALALEGFSDGSVAKYVNQNSADNWLEYYRLLGCADTGDCAGFDSPNFKLEFAMQHLSDYGSIELRLNDAKKINWEDVDWNNTTIQDTEGNEWRWQENEWYREDGSGNRYYWCNDTACPGVAEGIYNQDDLVYEYVRGHDVDLDGNRYYSYWNADTTQNGYEIYNASGNFVDRVFWVDGYYTDNNGAVYEWSFGEYRDISNPDNILDWNNTSLTYTWTEGYYVDESDTPFDMPAREWVDGKYVSAENSENTISEFTYWNMTESSIEGHYYRADDPSITQTQWDNNWIQAVDINDMVTNTSRSNWDAKLWNIDFRMNGGGDMVWGEYRNGSHQTAQLQINGEQINPRGWYKVTLSVFGQHLEIEIVDADGEVVGTLAKTDYVQTTPSNSGLYFLDLSVRENALLIDNVVVTQLDESGDAVSGDGNLLSTDFSSSILVDAFAVTRQYDSDW